jgi:hypothetical protein
MGVHSARLSDLPTIRRLDHDGLTTVLTPTLTSRQPSAVTLTVLSSWRSVGQRTQTLVLSNGNAARGFIQARSRPGRESWDIVRLACSAEDDEAWNRACAELLDRACGATAQRGALRTFVRVPSDSEHLTMLAENGFRQYATELTHQGTLSATATSAPEPGPDIRVRHPRDAWDIFSMYCAVTPALVRHAEGRSLKEWTAPSRFASATLRRWPCSREVVLGEPGELRAWLRWEPARHGRPQVIDMLVRPEATERLGELIRFAAENLGLDANCITICKAREYDGRISATLEEAGFDAIFRETLLVRHTVARVTERQLLVAALRAQGLGIDISHCHNGSEAVQHRLASSREIEHQYYDHYDRSGRASYYR